MEERGEGEREGTARAWEEAGPRGRAPQGHDRGRDARDCAWGAANAAGRGCGVTKGEGAAPSREMRDGRGGRA